MKQEAQEKWARWLALIFSSIALIDHMFEEGLPVRGAISHGKYFVNEQSVAGKSIIDALSLAQKINLSAETELIDIKQPYYLQQFSFSDMPENNLPMIVVVGSRYFKNAYSSSQESLSIKDRPVTIWKVL